MTLLRYAAVVVAAVVLSTQMETREVAMAGFILAAMAWSDRA